MMMFFLVCLCAGAATFCFCLSVDPKYWFQCPRCSCIHKESPCPKCGLKWEVVDGKLNLS